MKIESAKVPRQMGSAPCAGSTPCTETGPLFPPLHVNEIGIKSGVRAPPRNKMALFEQFTVPFNRHVPSHEVAVRNPTPTQHGGKECLPDHVSYAATATLVSEGPINREVGTNVRSSYGSSVGSLSSCSAIVNMDESRRVRMEEPGEDTSRLLKVAHERIQRTDKKASKDMSKDDNEVPAVDCSRACVQPESFHNPDDCTACGADDTKSVDITEHSHREAIHRHEDLAAAGSQLSGPEKGESECNVNRNALNNVQTEDANQPKNIGRFVEHGSSLGSNADFHQKPEVTSQDDSQCIVGIADVKMPIQSASSRERMKLAVVIQIPPSIKPKDVMGAVGQRLFWKARKAILRQQEIFSNQVFELHKLIRVQKLLAKMSGPLINEYMFFGGAPDKLGCDHQPSEGGYIEQENLGDRRPRASVPPQKYGGQAQGSKPQRDSTPHDESEGLKARTGVVPTASFPQVVMNAPFGQPCRSLSTDGTSAWGYPMGPLNRPFIYPSGSGSLPSGSPFNGAYVVGPSPPMVPFVFPCYSQRPEQTSAVCPTNQWPSAMYHNPFLAPAVNDWYAMNYQGRAPLASGSEKAGPTSSVPSINMKAAASTQCLQPAVFPGVGQQLGSSRLVATRSLGSHATASVSTPPNALQRKAGAVNVSEQSRGPSPGSGSECVASEGWGTYEGEKKGVGVDALGWSRSLKGKQLLTIDGGRRQDRRDVNVSTGGNALNLFPLQPLSSTGGYSEGRISRQHTSQGQVIKAVPRSALAASESAAGILLSIQRERQQ